MSRRDHQFDGKHHATCARCRGGRGHARGDDRSGGGAAVWNADPRQGRWSGSTSTSRISTTPTTKNVYAFNAKKHRRAACRQQREGALGHRQARARRLWARRNRKGRHLQVQAAERADHAVYPWRRLAQWAFIRLRRQCRAVHQSRRPFRRHRLQQCDRTGGDLFPMVDQCRRAVAWVYRNAASFGGDANALYLSSRSSGSHLGGCVSLPIGRSKAAARYPQGCGAGHGMYDLKPVRLSKRANYVKFTMRWKRRSRPSVISTRFTRRSFSPTAPWRRRNFSASRATSPPRSGGGQAGPADRRQGLQSLRDGETLGHPTHHGPGRDGDDEARNGVTQVSLKSGPAIADGQGRT